MVLRRYGDDIMETSNDHETTILRKNPKKISLAGKNFYRNNKNRRKLVKLVVVLADQIPMELLAEIQSLVILPLTVVVLVAMRLRRNQLWRVVLAVVLAVAQEQVRAVVQVLVATQAQVEK